MHCDTIGRQGEGSSSIMMTPLPARCYPLVEETVSLTAPGCRIFYLHDVETVRTGLRFSVNGDRYETAVCGRFQAMNLTAVIALCHLLAIPVRRLRGSIRALVPLDGRMQKVWTVRSPLSITRIPPAPVWHCIRSVGEIAHRRIITVIGCGGRGWDAGKQARIREIASSCGDLCILPATIRAGKR